MVGMEKVGLGGWDLGFKVQGLDRSPRRVKVWPLGCLVLCLDLWFQNLTITCWALDGQKLVKCSAWESEGPRMVKGEVERGPLSKRGGGSDQGNGL
jgi:hypothetical protein